MIFNSKHMVIVVVLSSAPCMQPMEKTLEAFGFLEVGTQASKNLLQAARDGNLQRVQALLHEGADINIQDDGWAPLNLAACWGHKEIVEIFFVLVLIKIAKK